MTQEKGTKLCKAKELSQQMIHAADAARSQLDLFDAGTILGPGKAETWGINPLWEKAAHYLTAKMKPAHFSWDEACYFGRPCPRPMAGMAI